MENKQKNLEARDAHMVFITIYEGDKSRKSRLTKKDCYQLNWRCCDYIPEIVSVFGAGNVRQNQSGYFVCTSEVV